MSLAHNKPSLISRLAGLMSFALIVLLLGNMVLNVLSTRNLLQQQLYVHAQDSATSLGLSLSSVIDANDDVAAGRMIDAIFDSGDFYRIVFIGVDKTVKVDKRLVAPSHAAPELFVSLVALDAPSATAQVMSGWRQLGELVVQSSTDEAYQRLWDAAQTQLLWFALVLVSALLFLRVVLRKLLSPLRDVEYQARQVANRRFGYRPPEPASRELYVVSQALNEMSSTLGEVFEQQLNTIEDMRQKSRLDALTGLYNRQGFDQRLKAALESKGSESQGTLIFLKLQDFESVNLDVGRASADQILCSLAEVLQGICALDMAAYAARRTGAEYSVFLPHVLEDEADTVAEKLMSTLTSLSWVRQSLRDDSIHLGLACVRATDDAATLLSKADLALRTAQANGVSGWQRYANIAGEGVSGEVRAANHWLQLIQEVLAKESVALYQQSVKDVESDSVLFRQVLARIESDGELLSAGVFLPMAKRFNLMPQFDRMVIEKVLTGNAGAHESYGVSVSEASLVDEEFLAWFENILSRAPQWAGRLLVQIPEYVIAHHESVVQAFCRLAHQFDVKVVIENFGTSSVPFAYLQRLEIDAIKIDHSFVREIQLNRENQFFVRSVAQLANSQSVRVIAVGVESEKELATLKTLGITGVMGYLLDHPDTFV